MLVLAGASAWGPFPASMTDSLFSFPFFSLQRGGTAQPGSACRLFPGCCFGIRFVLSPSELRGEREVERELHKCHAECTLSPTKRSLAAIPPPLFISMAGWCCPGMFSAPFGDLLDSSQLDYFFLMLICCFILLGGMFPPLFEKILESVLQAARIFKTCFFFHYFFPEK